jgi:hypothetical protein
MPNPCEYRARSLVRYMPTQPYHLLRHAGAIDRLAQAPATIEGEKRPSDRLGSSSIRA